MAANSTLIPVKAQGWTAGLTNLVNRELASWWRNRRNLIQLALWVVIINGLILAVLSSNQPTDADGNTLAQQAVYIYCIVSGFIGPIGVMVATQGSIVGEKQNGTAAWILSKPVSRTAFILSKLLADGMRFLITMIFLPGLVAYFLMTGFGIPLQFPAMLAGMGLLCLNLLFFQCFTLMMGTFFDSRRMVMGSSLILIFVLNQITQMNFGFYLPGHLPLDAAVVIASQPFQGVVSLLETIVLIIVFLLLAFWRFAREEF
jgi:ABC-2 type transport system permease protein